MAQCSRVDRDQLGPRRRPAAAARPGRRRSGSPCWPGPGACPPRSVAMVTGRPAKPTTPLTTTSAVVDQVGQVGDDLGERQGVGHLGPARRIGHGHDLRPELAGLRDQRRRPRSRRPGRPPRSGRARRGRRRGSACRSSPTSRRWRPAPSCLQSPRPASRCRPVRSIGRRAARPARTRRYLTQGSSTRAA